MPVLCRRGRVIVTGPLQPAEPIKKKAAARSSQPLSASRPDRARNFGCASTATPGSAPWVGLALLLAPAGSFAQESRWSLRALIGQPTTDACANGADNLLQVQQVMPPADGVPDLTPRETLPQPNPLAGQPAPPGPGPDGQWKLVKLAAISGDYRGVLKTTCVGGDCPRPAATGLPGTLAVHAQSLLGRECARLR